MKVTILLLAVLACAVASGPGLQPVPNGLAAPYRNADRQRAVNHVAEHVGAGTGTARYYGVPGADRYGYYRPNGYYGGHFYHPGFPAYGYGYPYGFFGNGHVYGR